jgi:hypothetical protein
MSPFLRYGRVPFACTANLELAEKHKAARGAVRLRKFFGIGSGVLFESHDVVASLADRGRQGNYYETWLT